MNRRRLFIALAVLLTIVLFGAARWTASANESWRTVAIGEVKKADTVVEVSNRYLSVYSNETGNDTLFDLKTGAQRPMYSEGIIPVGDWKWKLVMGRKVQMQLRRANGPVKLYNCPNFEPDGLKPNFPDWVRVSLDRNRFEALLMNRYYCWELNSRRLKCNMPFDFNVEGAVPLANDGKSLVKGDYRSIIIVSASSGRIMRRVSLPANYEATQFSPLGSYALCDTASVGSSRMHNLVVDVCTGRALWSFNLDHWMSNVTFSPDETLVAIPLSQRRIWQIRDTKTGRILRTLPLLPNVHTGAFSPDNSMFYYVANGVIYRQRVR